MHDLWTIQRNFFKKISSHVGVDPQVSIYRNNYFGVLSNTLNSIYPVCRELIGAEAFRTITTSFIKSTLSTNVSLDNYGSELPTFLASHPVTLQVEYIPDIARLEQAIHIAFHSNAEADFLTLPQLQQLIQTTDSNLINFRLGESVSIIESQFPIYDIWQYHQLKDTTNLDFDDDANNVIVYWLKEGGVRVEKADSTAIELIRTIASTSSVSKNQEDAWSNTILRNHHMLLKIFSNHWVVAY